MKKLFKFKRIKKPLAYLAISVFLVNSSFVAELIPQAKAATDGSNVVINEIQVKGAAASDEFVELYNPTAGSIDITGWVLKYKSATGSSWTTRATLSGSIASQGYYLAGSGDIEATPDVSWSATLADDGGHVKLLDAGSNQVDLVGYGTADSAEGGSSAPAPSANQSIERANGVDTDNNALDFSLKETSDPQNSYWPAPVVTIDQDKLNTNDTTPVITGTIDDSNAVIGVNIDGTDYGNANKGDGAWDIEITPSLTGGSHNLQVTATDEGGNIGIATGVLEIDLTAPVVSVDSLITNDQNPTLTGAINDSTASVEITIGINTYSATNNGETWTVNITDPLDAGVYDVQAQATDLAGNVGSDTTLDELGIDLTKPGATTGSAFVEFNGNLTNNNNPTVTGNCPSDEDVSKVDVEFKTQTTEGSKTYTKEANCVNGSYSTQGTDQFTELSAASSITGLGDGVYKVIATAIDKAGNKSDDEETIKESLTIDTTAPTAPTNLQVTAKDPNSVTLSWTGSTDTGSGIGGYHLYWGTEKGKYTSSRDVGNNTTYTLSGLSPNTAYYFEVKAYDKAGNGSVVSNEVEEQTPQVLAQTNTNTSASLGNQGIVESAKAANPQDEQKTEPPKEETKNTDKKNNNLFLISILLLILGTSGYYVYNTKKGKLGNFKFPKLPGIRE